MKVRPGRTHSQLEGKPTSPTYGRVPMPRSTVDHMPEPIRLAILEEGGPRFDAHVRPEEFEKTVVVVQLPGETVDELAEHAHRAMTAVARASRRVGQLMLVCGPPDDLRAMKARFRLCKSLLVSARRSRGVQELVVTTDGRQPEVRHAFMALVEALVAESGGDRLMIRLRFTDTPSEPRISKSGFYRSPVKDTRDPVMEELRQAVSTDKCHS